VVAVINEKKTKKKKRKCNNKKLRYKIRIVVKKKLSLKGDFGFLLVPRNQNPARPCTYRVARPLFLGTTCRQNLPTKLIPSFFFYKN